MKYAVDRSLAGSKYEDEDVGTSLNRVLQYFTLRDKFNGIHPALARDLGIKEVKVTMEGLKFLRYKVNLILTFSNAFLFVVVKRKMSRVNLTSKST